MDFLSLYLVFLVVTSVFFPGSKFTRRYAIMGFFPQNFWFDPDLEGIENNLEVYFINIMYICVCINI